MNPRNLTWNGEDHAPILLVAWGRLKVCIALFSILYLVLVAHPSKIAAALCGASFAYVITSPLTRRTMSRRLADRQDEPTAGFGTYFKEEDPLAAEIDALAGETAQADAVGEDARILDAINRGDYGRHSYTGEWLCNNYQGTLGQLSHPDVRRLHRRVLRARLTHDAILAQREAFAKESHG